MGSPDGTSGDVIQLGEVAPHESMRLGVLKAAVAEARKGLQELIDKAGNSLSGSMKWTLWEQNAPLEYEEYRHAVGKADSLKRQWRNSEREELAPDVFRFAGAFDRVRHTPDAQGYMRYLADTFPPILAAMVRKERERAIGAGFPEKDRELHTHMVAGRSSGKSELLKLLVHHYVKHPELGAVVVLDPHNDLVRAISRWREFATDPERLVYLDLSLSRGHYPALNPLAVKGLDAESRADFASLMAEAIEAFAPSRGMTDNMRTLATNGLRVALEQANPTLDDLRRLLGDPKRNPKARAMIERAEQHRDLGEWFTDGFKSPSLDASKSGLAARLDAVLTRPKIGRALRATNSLDLDSLCDERKVIVVGLGGEGGEQLGRLILAQLFIIGKRRLTRRGKRVPVHVFVDEAQLLIGPTAVKMMNELRKAGFRVTLAHQSLSQFDSPSLREQVWDGAGVKILGATDDREALNRLLGSNSAAIPMHQFAVRWGMVGREGVVMLTESLGHLRDGRNDMSAKDHAALMERQLATYYRPLEDEPPPAPDEAGEFTLR